MDIDSWCDEFIDEDVGATGGTSSVAPQTEATACVPTPAPLVTPPAVAPPPASTIAELSPVVPNENVAGVSTEDDATVEDNVPDIESLWFPDIHDSLQPVRDCRGEQVQVCNAASMCTGMAPCAKSVEQHGIKAEWKFMSDCKEAAFNFVVSNCPKPQHWFVNAQELCREEDNQTEWEEGTGGGTTNARCAFSNFIFCSLFISALFLDLLVGA